MSDCADRGRLRLPDGNVRGDRGVWRKAQE